MMTNPGPGEDKDLELNREIYCRKLGHHIPVSYCLSPGQEKFCSSFRNCWFSRMDVDAFLEARFTPEEIEAAEKPSVPKVTGIMSVIERFADRTGEDDLS